MKETKLTLKSWKSLSEQQKTQLTATLVMGWHLSTSGDWWLDENGDQTESSQSGRAWTPSRFWPAAIRVRDYVTQSDQVDRKLFVEHLIAAIAARLVVDEGSLDCHDALCLMIPDDICKAALMGVNPSQHEEKKS